MERNAKFRQTHNVPPVVGEKEVFVNDSDTVLRRKLCKQDAARVGDSIDFKVLRPMI